MHTFFKKILIYVLICGAVVHLFTLIGGRYLNTYYHPNLHIPVKEYGFTYTRFREVKLKKGIDVLVLGNSHAYRGYDPRLFKQEGVELFNLGSSSQTPYQSMYLLERYLDELDPCLVVLETNPLSFVLDGQEAALDFLANEAYSIELLKMTAKVNCFPTHLAHQFAMMNSVLPQDTISEPKVIGNDEYINGGYVEKVAPLDFNDQFPFDAYALVLDQFEEFMRMISFLKEKGQDYMIVYAPVTPRFYKEYSKRIDFITFLEQRGEEVLDFNQYPELTDQENFYDLHHMDQDGVFEFNKKLVQEMQLECN